MPEFLAAVRLKPKDAEIRRSYASALAEQGRKEEAVKQLRELLQLKPDTEARVQLATLLYQTGKFGEAVAEYRQVLAAKPDQPEALNNLAWLLATSPDSAVRNGAEAVRFAEQGCRLTEYQQAQMLGTLAAAYAEAGRFTEAVATAQKAIELARAGGDARFAAVNEQLLKLYRAGKPYHEPPPTVSRPAGSSAILYPCNLCNLWLNPTLRISLNQVAQAGLPIFVVSLPKGVSILPGNNLRRSIPSTTNTKR